MKKAIFGIIAGVLLLNPAVSMAAVITAPGGDFAGGWAGGAGAGGQSGLNNTTLADLVYTIMAWLLGILAVAAIIGFVVSGLFYITAAGDEAKIEKAKSTMTYSIIGIVVALIGWIAVTAISTFLGAESQF